MQTNNVVILLFISTAQDLEKRFIATTYLVKMSKNPHFQEVRVSFY